MVFLPYILPMLEELCNQLHRVNLKHRDLHYGNVAIELSPGRDTIKRLVFIDLSAIRPLGKEDPQCKRDNLIDELDFSWKTN